MWIVVAAKLIYNKNYIKSYVRYGYHRWGKFILYFISANLSLCSFIYIFYCLYLLYALVCTVDHVIWNELWNHECVEPFAVLNGTDSPSTVEGYSPLKGGYHTSLTSTGGEGSNPNTHDTGSGHSSAVNSYPGPASADPGSYEPGSASPAPSTVSSDDSMQSRDSGNPYHGDEEEAASMERIRVLEGLDNEKNQLKSLLVATEARDAGNNLTQDQQNLLNSNDNPSSADVKKELTGLRNKIWEVNYDNGEIDSHSEDSLGSENTDMFPDEDED